MSPTSNPFLALPTPNNQATHTPYNHHPTSPECVQPLLNQPPTSSFPLAPESPPTAAAPQEIVSNMTDAPPTAVKPSHIMANRAKVGTGHPLKALHAQQLPSKPTCYYSSFHS